MNEKLIISFGFLLIVIGLMCMLTIRDNLISENSENGNYLIETASGDFVDQNGNLIEIDYGYFGYFIVVGITIVFIGAFDILER